jgi:hypothetical protein
MRLFITHVVFWKFLRRTGKSGDGGGSGGSGGCFHTKNDHIAEPHP